MKTAIMILASAIASVAGTSHAQTCASPIALRVPEVVTGDTCTAQNELGTICIFASSPANDIVYSFTFATGMTSIELSNNTPAWNAALLLLSGPCNGNTPCPRTADAGGPGGGEALDVSSLAEGNYLVVVTATNNDTSCGSFGLSLNGTPVTLQSFEII